jgi:D-alanine-D-alanine ligase
MKKRVAILCGGPGSEHEISCLSASGVLSAIDQSKFEPILIGITRTGKWMLLPLDYPLAMQAKRLPSITGDFPEVIKTKGGLAVAGSKLAVDIIFPVLHGTYGEDGQLQKELAQVGIKYVGSAAAASELAMDKAESKLAFARHGIHGAPGISVTIDEWKKSPQEITESIKDLGLPIFVKAARGGSSRGTVKVKDYRDFSAAMAEALSYDSKVLVESAIVGAEVECAVLETGGSVNASIPGKVWIDPHFDFYDFEAKYLDGATRIDIPAPFDPLVNKAIREKAIAAFKAIGCRGLARVDFFVTPSNEIIINEINTMPGFTQTSAFPKMWQASGISYREVITTLLKG